jgi:hypothetical protein
MYFNLFKFFEKVQTFVWMHTNLNKPLMSPSQIFFFLFLGGHIILSCGGYILLKPNINVEYHVFFNYYTLRFDTNIYMSNHHYSFPIIFTW